MIFTINKYTEQMLALFARACAVLPGLLLIYSSAIYADEAASSLIPPEDPTQSITYWKKYALQDDDELVQLSQQVFSVLLRAWDQSRIEPGLYVVESGSGAWAASLADGNILLSKQAIETCFSFGKQRGEHLLAFVLAHELAHQRADDLWHQRFFRMIGTQSVESQKKMMAGLELDGGLLSRLEQKEAQADHDGLVLMSSVGFDAYQITSDKDFFTLWVENIWQQNCVNDQNMDDQSINGQSLNSLAQRNNYDACRQAQARALRAQAQLETVAAQTMLYDLGVQEFVAGNYASAREYFTVYGRDYPGRAIISAIGQSYFSQAQAIQQQLNALRSTAGMEQLLSFYYPMILDAQVADSETRQSSENKRADIRSAIATLEKQKSSLLEKSIKQFEKAIRLAPDYQQTYLSLASAHLLANNSFRVRGVLQGQYIPRFGSDAAVAMLLALTMQIEGDTEKAITLLRTQIEHLKSSENARQPIAENILRYSVFHNLANIYRSVGKPEEAEAAWIELAQLSKKSGDALLFRLALAQVDQKKYAMKKQQLLSAPSINGSRLGDRLSLSAATSKSDLWIDGERYEVLTDGDVRYITQKNGELISVWQSGGTAGSREKMPNVNQKLYIGDDADRPFKALGIPDRRLNMTSGEYLAYDEYGLAIRVSNGRIKGWFLYDNR